MSSDFKAKRLDGDLILLPDTESNEDGVYKALSTVGFWATFFKVLCSSPSLLLRSA